MVNDLWIGYMVGFLASIAVGPIGVLCIQRTITKKFLGGYISALGAATADTIYAAIALYAISFIMPYLDAYSTAISIIVGCIIIFMGLRIFFSKISRPTIKHNRQSKMSFVKDYLSVFFLTISNPVYLTIFLFYFASFRVNGDELSTVQNLFIILGVLLGAATWWFILTFSISLARKKFRAKHIYYFNKIAGIVISIFGVVSIVKGLLG